ncbi:hypothetical protein H7K45_18530 [Mycobacterium yunnanensis]|uniref:Uncharacterized protein n=1 Tax=Mycobacterium yunnanensis TaxID=368477 RepID=A0A9X2Z4T8_9MYCO|nr:hypothetical protein [Mycobacterium yunnanensis]MCV7422544.1 hypothetical protein [Mycobacterium yunnanensis]
MHDEQTTYAGLAGWQATGLAVAAAAMAARTGLGSLIGAIILLPVVYALVRLRRHAPNAASTAELVGSAVGPRGAAFALILQVSGYALIAVTAAQTIALFLVPPEPSEDPFGPPQFNAWLWSLWAVAAIAAAATAVFALSDRMVATLAAVLAACGLLIQFYYGLAVIARGLSGSTSGQPVDAAAAPTGLVAAGTLALAAVSLAGFEVVTARTRRESTNGWPMGLGVGAVTLVAVIGWWACQHSGFGAGSLDGSSFGLAVMDFYGDTGMQIVDVGTAMFIAAALVALLWGIAKATERLGTRVPSDAVFGGAVVAMVVLAIVVIHARWTLGYVGGLVLFALYGLVLIANSRIAADGVVSWWLRLIMPIVFAAVVLVPLAWAEFDTSAVKPVAVAAAVIAAAAGAAVAGTRSRAG